MRSRTCGRRTAVRPALWVRAGLLRGVACQVTKQRCERVCDPHVLHPITSGCVPATPGSLSDAYIHRVPHDLRFTPAGKDFPSRSPQRGRVPLDPMPDWVPARRREIGARIRTARHDAGLSQVELGERIGRDHKTVHRYEYGTRIPNLEDLLLIADALDIPLADLVR